MNDLFYEVEGRRIRNVKLLTSGKLNSYLADIEEQAQGITEQLKTDNILEWIGRMKDIQTGAREIMEKEIIFA